MRLLRPEKFRRNKKRAVLAVVFLASVSLFAAAVPRQVGAHAKFLRSRPANGEVLRRAPEAIVLEFSAGLQTGGLNSVAVTAAGNAVRRDKNTVVLSADGRQLICPLEDLEPGDYTVEWRALSSDDHAMKGTFSFRLVAGAEESAGGGEDASRPAPETPARGDQPPAGHRQHTGQESAVDAAQIAARWLTHLAVMTLFGSFAFWLLVMRPALIRETEDFTEGEGNNRGFEEGEKRLARLARLSLALLAVTLPAGLILQTSAVTGTAGLSDALAPQNLSGVLTGTGYGLSWIVQAALFLALLGVVFLTFRKNGAGRKDKSVAGSPAGPPAPFLWVGLGLCAGMLLALGSTGHARAAAAEYPLAVVSNWLHLLAVGVWVGGLFQLALTLPKAVAAFDARRRRSVLLRVIPLFSRSAIAAAVLITLTGIYNSSMHLDDFSDLWKTGYGIVLSLKIALFLPMLALGGFNTFVFRPRVAEAARAAEKELSVEPHRRPEGEDRGFYNSVRVEAAAGLIVLLLAAVLSFLPTARRHETGGERRGERISNSAERTVCRKEGRSDSAF